MKERRVDGRKERLWRDRIRRQQQSGLSIRAFCAREALREPSFYWWRRALGHCTSKSAGGVRPPTQRQYTLPALSEAPQLVPVTVTSSPCPVIEIALPGGAVVRVPQDCSSQLLREVLAALESTRC